MMIVVGWMVYCAVIAALLTAGAAAWEAAARWSGRPARWAWLFALVGSTTLPWLLRLVPERGWADAVPGGLALMEPLMLSAGSATASGVSAQGAALGLWAFASLMVLGYLYVVLLQISRARRHWRVAEVDGARVFVTGGMGPGAVGVRNAAVAVPAWVLDLDAGLRALLLKHERAHVEAGDPRLLFAGLILLAAMPWNPLVWFQLLRLRNAIELDCDARVLATGADPARYGSLLLEVGRRRSTHAFVMATFAEPQVFLEQRIRRIARWPLEYRRGRAALFTGLALTMVAIALSCDPVRVTEPTDAIPVDDPTGSDAKAGLPDSIAAEPVFTPMTQAPELLNRDEVDVVLKNNYPPLLREAGIEGAATVHLYIDAAGSVKRMQLSRSSGYPALDEAALNVAKAMRFEPAHNVDKKVAVWVEVPVVFESAASRAKEIRRDNVERNLEILRERIDQSPEREPLPHLTGERQFTPMTEAPELLNREETHRVLLRSYPPLLRDAGIGGIANVAFSIDATGAVVNTELSRSSGYPALDEAALTVSATMKFRPALKDGDAVPVWVEIPIAFTAK